MSQAPCTLFWPRSGFTPPPAIPRWPQSMARLASDLTLSVPVVCWVIPMQYRMLARSAVAYMRAASIRSWRRDAGDLFDVFGGVGFNRFPEGFEASVRFSTNVWS